MKPFDTTRPGQTAELSFTIDLRHAPEKVWRALTDPVLLAQWLLPVVDLTLKPGAPFRYQGQPHPGWDGIVNCRILAIDAPRMLSYAWVVGEMDTVVTFTIEPIASGTRLVLVHSGFKQQNQQNFGGARYGWMMMGGKLSDLLASVS